MADEAAVVGVAKVTWAAACSRCEWLYTGINRQVDMAARAHCAGCGGDVVAMSVPGKEVVLRLERDVLGRVVTGDVPGTLDTEDPTMVAMREYGQKISQPGYWKMREKMNEGENPWD